MAVSVRTWMIWLVIIALAGWFVLSVQAILLPFVLGMLMAYLLDPITDRLETVIPRGLATILMIILFFGLLFLCLFLLVPVLIDQTHALLLAAPEHIALSKAFLHQEWADIQAVLPVGSLEKAEAQLNGMIEQMANAVGQVALGALSNGAAFVQLLSLLLITPVVAFYCLRDWDKIIASIDGLLPRPYAGTIRTQCQKIDDTLSGFLRGQLNVCVMMAIFYGVGMALVGLESAFLVGAIAGILLVIPYAGTVLTALLALGLAWAQFSELQPVLLVGVVFVAGQMIEGSFLTPKLVGDKVGLHPMWLIFGMLAGGTLLGVVGVLLAVPLTAILGVLVKFLIEEYRESALYHGE